MALDEDTLAIELEAAFAAVKVGADANQEIAQAFATYFKDATLGGVTVDDGAVDVDGVDAMVAALNFDSEGTAADGAATFVAAFTAFWGAIASDPPTFWPAASVVTPATGLGSLSAALLSAFSANQDGQLTSAQAAENLAAAIHANAGLTGTGTLPGPTVTPIL